MRHKSLVFTELLMKLFGRRDIMRTLSRTGHKRICFWQKKSWIRRWISFNFLFCLSCRVTLFLEHIAYPNMVVHISRLVVVAAAVRRDPRDHSYPGEGHGDPGEDVREVPALLGPGHHTNDGPATSAALRGLFHERACRKGDGN